MHSQRELLFFFSALAFMVKLAGVVSAGRLCEPQTSLTEAVSANLLHKFSS